MRKGIVVSITMSNAMRTILDALCAREGLNRSQYVRKLVTKELEAIGLLSLEGDEPCEEDEEYQVDIDG